MPPLRVTHVITSLEVGGAQSVLTRLLKSQDPRTFAADVVSLTTLGPLGRELADHGIRVRALGMTSPAHLALAPWRLAAWLKGDRPDVVQTWMYHADLLGGLAARAAGVPVIWNIRHTDLPPETTKRTTRWIAAACAKLSRTVPSRIVSCSEASREVHAALGYADEKFEVIVNGFDLATFQPSPEARAALRQELAPETVLIGKLARFDAQKDHATFVGAAARLVQTRPHVQFLLAGDGISWENEALSALIRDAGLARHFHLLGRRADAPRLTAALDLATLSSSYGEGLPNVVGEAMASGVPCVVTNVGDAARLVGDTGLVVPTRSPDALAAAWMSLLAEPPDVYAARGRAARERVMAHYELSQMIRRYEALHAAVAGERRA